MPLRMGMEAGTVSKETTPSEAAKKLAATIVKRANEGVYQKLGLRVSFAPTGLETLIQMYFDDEREAGRREMAEHVDNFCARSPLCSTSFE